MQEQYFMISSVSKHTCALLCVVLMSSLSCDSQLVL